MDLKGSLRCNDATATRMPDNDRFHKQDNNFARVSQLIFLYISLPFFGNEDVIMPNFLRFMENVNKQRRVFFGGGTWIWSLGIHLQQFHLYLT